MFFKLFDTFAEKMFACLYFIKKLFVIIDIYMP